MNCLRCIHRSHCFHCLDSFGAKGLTDSSGGNKQVGGFSHTCVENAKHLQQYYCVFFHKCVPFPIHMCQNPNMCGKKHPGVNIPTCLFFSKHVG